jgi:hypothetical protein
MSNHPSQRRVDVSAQALSSHDRGIALVEASNRRAGQLTKRANALDAITARLLRRGWLNARQSRDLRNAYAGLVYELACELRADARIEKMPSADVAEWPPSDWEGDKGDAPPDDTDASILAWFDLAISSLPQIEALYHDKGKCDGGRDCAGRYYRNAYGLIKHLRELGQAGGPDDEQLCWTGSLHDAELILRRLRQGLLSASIVRVGEHVSARHSIDFRSVQWSATPHTFTAAQAACVKVLWEAWKNGTPEVGGAAVLNEAECDAHRLIDVFRDKSRSRGLHPAWGTMIVSGATKGAFRLSATGN